MSDQTPNPYPPAPGSKKEEPEIFVNLLPGGESSGFVSLAAENTKLSLRIKDLEDELATLIESESTYRQENKRLLSELDDAIAAKEQAEINFNSLRMDEARLNAENSVLWKVIKTIF